jgi:hypothetical protein
LLSSLDREDAHDFDDGWTGDCLHLKEQRAALSAFAKAIGARTSLGQDEAGNPRIEGRRGSVYVQPATAAPGRKPMFQIWFAGSTQSWRFAKEAISRFAKLTNDGEVDGMFALDHMPTKFQGDLLRDKLVIPKRKTYSDDTLAAMRTRLAASRPTASSGAHRGACRPLPWSFDQPFFAVPCY